MESVGAQEKSSSTRRSRIVGLIALPFVCVGAYWLGSSYRDEPPSEPIPQPPIHVDSASLDFGEVFETKIFRWQLSLCNTTDHPIEILRFDSSCNCAAVEPHELHLPAGGTASVQVVLDLTHRSAGVPSVDLYSHQATITAVLAEGKQSWLVKGRVRSPLDISENVVNFGDDLIRGIPAKPRTITVRPRIPIGQITVNSSVRSVVTTLNKHSDHYELVIAPNTSAAVGNTKSEIFLHITGANGEALPDQTILVTGVVTEPVVAFPGSVEFGAQKLGNVVEETIVLHSRTGVPFQVREVRCDSRSVEVASLPNAQTNGCAFLLRKRIHERGDKTDRVFFEIDYGEGERLTIPLDVRFHVGD